MYEDFASTYDLFDEENWNQTAEFLVSKSGGLGPVLDFGGGTGGLTLELIRRGISVDYYDPSEPMRAVLLGRLPYYRYYLDKVRIFADERLAFGIVRPHTIIAHNVLFLIEFHSLSRLVTSFADISADGGIFVFNFINKNFQGRTCSKHTMSVAVGGEKWERRSQTQRISECELLVTWELDLSAIGGKVATEAFRVRLHTLEEWITVLDPHFIVQSVFGDFAQNPYRPEASPSCVVVAARN